MDEPAVTVFVEGSRQNVTGAQWPPKEVAYTSLYLRPRGRLSFEPEPMGAEHVAPDGFYQAPLTVTDKVETLSWSTAPFDEPTEMIGQGAAHLFAATFPPGHRLVVELSNAEPPDAFHLPVGRPVTHKIYRDAAHRSRLVPPFTRRDE